MLFAEFQWLIVLIRLKIIINKERKGEIRCPNVETLVLSRFSQTVILDDYSSWKSTYST